MFKDFKYKNTFFSPGDDGNGAGAAEPIISDQASLESTNSSWKINYTCKNIIRALHLFIDNHFETVFTEAGKEEMSSENEELLKKIKSETNLVHLVELLMRIEKEDDFSDFFEVISEENSDEVLGISDLANQNQATVLAP